MKNGYCRLHFTKSSYVISDDNTVYELRIYLFRMAT